MTGLSDIFPEKKKENPLIFLNEVRYIVHAVRTGTGQWQFVVRMLLTQLFVI